ncbi:MAG TPA: hypothetical protein VGL98_03285 [Gammaproteobacteria bacterium]
MSRMLGLLVLSSALGAVSAPAQQVDLPFGDLVTAAAEEVANQCERLLDAPPSPNELLEREAEMSKAVFCDCMPPALNDLGRGRGAQTLIGSDEFGALVMREFDVCGARAVRETTRRDCTKFTPPNAPPTYCACFSAAVDDLTDEQIIEDSIASRDNLEQRRDARNNSAPEPPLFESLMARIDRQCRLPAPAQ